MDLQKLIISYKNKTIGCYFGHQVPWSQISSRHYKRIKKLTSFQDRSNLQGKIHLLWEFKLCRKPTVRLALTSFQKLLYYQGICKFVSRLLTVMVVDFGLLNRQGQAKVKEFLLRIEVKN